MSALKKCMSLLNKARVDEGLSPNMKAKQRAQRNTRSYGLGDSAPKSTIKRHGQFSEKDGAMAGKKGERIVGVPKKVTGIHTQPTVNRDGHSAVGSAVRSMTKYPKSPFNASTKTKVVAAHKKVIGEMKKIKPKLVKCMDWLEKANKYEKEVGVANTKEAKRSNRSIARSKYGYHDSNQSGVHTKIGTFATGSSSSDAKNSHKTVQRTARMIRPKLVKAMQWLEQNDLQKGENDELAFHAERARAAQSANKTAIAKEHFLAFLKIATEQCKIANSIWGMRSLFNKTLDYYLDLADTKLYSSNQGEIANGTSDAALVIYFKNGGKFENYKG